ncbi:cell envelope integrity protein CreD [Viridibacterium curvum]|uniref:Cell envelope integrity protein CreD n=1 Tax=Viridibacterium curvum TaxID=1101404 RepID=A0ABP9QRP6_9RHOO
MKGFVTKLLVVGVVGVLLMIAGMMLNSVVRDRLFNRQQARESVTESMADAQRIAGASLVIPYVEQYQDVETDPVTRNLRTVTRRVDHQLEVLPERTDFKGDMVTDPRYRGLFRVNGYVLGAAMNGDFDVPPLDKLTRNKTDSQIKLGTARLVVGISDPRGLRRLEMKLDGTPYAVEAGTGEGRQRQGAQALIENSAALFGRKLRFEMNIDLVGTDSLQLVPLGRESTARISSPWPHPSFGGRFLPVDKQISERGFSANWRVSALATTARSTWKNLNETPDAFSVSLIDPVDIYVLADRASKYASLFVAITLGGFLLFELLRSLRLHALHYLLVGAALLIFFLLLLGLSERLGFALAYAAASTACVLLISIYAMPLLRSVWLAAGFGAGLAALYGALYMILISEQNALLMGSLLLFGLLAAVMLGTRKVDWHALLAERAVPDVLPAED